MNKGRLIVLSAPSGCGKGTVLKEILKDDKFYCTVSATTRAPREGEVDGINYYFLSMEQFEEHIKNDGLLEYAKYCDNYYGTLKSEIEGKLNEGKNVILEIEVQGAMQVKKLLPDTLTIFLAPPTVDTLRERLLKRGTETEEVIAKRVAQAEEELQFADKYEYIIVNDVLEDAVEDFKAVVKADSLRTKNAAK